MIFCLEKSRFINAMQSWWRLNYSDKGNRNYYRASNASCPIEMSCTDK
jgi:hypothetical protein